MSSHSGRRASGTSVDHIHRQMEWDEHYPFDLQSGWLPAPSSSARRTFLQRLLDAEAGEYDPSVQALDALICANPVLEFLVADACARNGDIIDAHLTGAETVDVPRIASKQDLLDTFNKLLTQVPQFIDNELVGLPFSAFVVGIDPTLSGQTLFRLPMFNEKLGAILDTWHTYLGSPASNWIFGTEGEQWLSTDAKKQYQFEVWEKDSETLPYWTSWNSFFTRQFKDPAASRPVASPEDNAIVTGANDGSLFRWEDNVADHDVFWFKDMPYSIADILSSSVPAQQAVIDQHDLVDLFTDGSIFQTYLNPYNFHRWWCPVNGSVLFDPLAVPGAYFNKLVIPDFGGATTASLPYLAQVNARGLIVLETPDFGYVCCIPLGMSEVSTITFDPAMTAGSTVRKGQEMGRFQYGGSSFALLFQKLPGKRLIFISPTGDMYEKLPVLPKGSASTGGNVTQIGAQLGVWQDVDTQIDSTLPWQNAGYVNTGKSYRVDYIGGLWTANPNDNGGNLYGPDGSTIIATQDGYPLVGAAEGALVARVAQNPPFLVGTGAIVPPGQVGQLQLVINDDIDGRYGGGLTDNEGQILVRITHVE
jgi:phosphatidylserine decarboxylase